ncbi:MAG: HAD family hydrolase [Pseudomonadota bacterium]
MSTPEGTRPLSACTLVLATDLDGTFLGASEAERRRLYDWIEANRATVGLIFVTGRDPRFIARLCEGAEGLATPWPEYVIGDVGTTIAAVTAGTGEARITPIPALEADIAQRWADNGARVRQALDGHPGLTLQSADFRYRISYDLDPATYEPSAAQIVSDLGLDHLISDNRFFDVLPRGVSKGPSLLRLIEHLGVDPARVLAAGDTLNDLSMLASGLKAVAVGNSEPGLLAHLDGLDNVHCARAPGAGGILEAIEAFALHPLSRGGVDAL